MEPLLGGKLAGGLPGEAVKIFAKANPELSPAAWALRWLWNQEEVTVVLSGMSERGQLEENMRLAGAAAPGMLTGEENQAFRDVLSVINAAYKIRCTGCNYCMPCPRGVNIPGCFASYNSSFTMGLIHGMKLYATSAALTSENTSGAGLCVKCGRCEKHCPQHIPVMQSLEAVRRRMEPFWYRGIISIARGVLGKNRRG